MASKVRLWRVKGTDHIWRTNTEKIIVAPNALEALKKAREKEGHYRLHNIKSVDLIAEED